VLDDLALGVQPEDVDTGVVVITGPSLVAVQDDEVPLSDSPDEVDPLTGYSRVMRSK
jgi:hypothetical protein